MDILQAVQLPLRSMDTSAPALFFFFCLFRASLCHMEVPRLGAELELQLLAYITARATRDLSLVCDLHHGSRQRRILNPLSEARDRTRILMVPSRASFHCTMTGTPFYTFFQHLPNSDTFLLLGWFPCVPLSPRQKST